MVNAEKPLRIAIVAGELSGDILGAGLMRAVLQRYPDAQFIGIGGPQMQALGCETLFDMEELAVMGLVEVLRHLPRLLQIKRTLVAHFLADPPDLFIGVDAPDFNLRLELALKQKGITTVHYVSPSVWAWRQKRIFSIAKATNLVLALLPFEKAFYDKFNVPCVFVGHTMADQIALTCDKLAARQKLQLAPQARYLAVLPGSRHSEMLQLAPIFVQTCALLQQKDANLQFVVALVNAQRRSEFEKICQQVAPQLKFILVDDTARDVIAASDAVLLASGTVALECMLLKRPMVVAYKVNAFTAWLARRLLRTPFVSLPNLLAGKALVPERLQEECTAEQLAFDVTTMLQSDNEPLMAQFTQLHQQIRCNADQMAAQAVLDLIGR
ncbi:MAG: lipid-A-disaccharide synthase [Enterovibrio sp.]